MTKEGSGLEGFHRRVGLLLDEQSSGLDAIEVSSVDAQKEHVTSEGGWDMKRGKSMEGDAVYSMSGQVFLVDDRVEGVA